MNRSLQITGLLCNHDARRVMVHPVEGGYRAHCLRCGALGRVQESSRAALEAVACRRISGVVAYEKKSAARQR